MTANKGARRGMRAAGAIGAATALALSLWSVPATAHAADLESLQNAAIKAGEDYQAAVDKSNELQGKIDENDQRISELEAQLPEQKQKAAAAIRSHYKFQQDQANLISLLLTSDSFSEFLSTAQYFTTITSSNLDEIEQLDSMEKELEQTKQDLESEKAAADAQVSVTQQAKEEADQTASAAEEKAKEDQAAKQAAYEAAVAQGTQDSDTNAALQAAASKSADTSSDSSSSSSSTSTSNGNGSSSSSSSSKGSSSSSSGSSSKGSGSSSSSSSSASYKYVQASMYGEGDGFMYGTTASGDTVTPTSMGVAMKTMPLGTVIEITYNGRTVRAVVNDRGPYAGNRQIDLQPAVAHALGFDGVGTVGYRVVS